MKVAGAEISASAASAAAEGGERAMVGHGHSASARDAETTALPKIIHCCWLGDKPKTELAKRCRASWERFAPDYEIREWTLADLVDASPPDFFKEAVRRKRWAFASDWVRFFALHKCGGVYFDYDFELERRLNFTKEFVAGQEMVGGCVGMEPAAIALERRNPLAKSMLDYYAAAPYGERTVGEILAEREGAEKLRVLSPKVMSPIGIDGKCRRSNWTVGVHRYAMNWASPRRKVAKWLSWHGMRPLVDFLLKVRR